MSTEQYWVMCKECKLSIEDLEHMEIGMAIDYIEEYVKMKNPDSKENKKGNIREANQSDFDNF